jgi:hypothetical protein
MSFKYLFAGVITRWSSARPPLWLRLALDKRPYARRPGQKLPQIDEIFDGVEISGNTLMYDVDSSKRFMAKIAATPLPRQ